MTLEIRQEDCRYIGTGKTSNDGGIDIYTMYRKPLMVYQAGPIKGCSYKGATDGREYAAAELRKRGIEALSPMRGKEFL